MMNNLPNLPDENKQQDNNVEDLMKVATENSVNTEIQTPQNDFKSLKKIFTIGGGVMAGFAGLLLIGALVINTKPQESIIQNSGNSNKTNNIQQAKEIPKEQQVNVWDFKYPIDVEDWTKQQYDPHSLSDEKFRSKLLAYSKKYQQFYNSVSWMPSGVKGNWKGAEEPYTNETWNKFIVDKDGINKKNPKYKYVLKEDYEIAYIISIQRFINPVFGDWVFAQRVPGKKLHGDPTFNHLKNLFHEDWWTTNIKENEDYSKLPILVDWNADNFGGLEFAEKTPGEYGTFFGVIDETDDKQITSSIVGTDKNGENILEVTTPIKYVAWGIDNSKITKYGSLKLTFVSNDDITRVNNRVVISNVEFIVN